MYKRVLTASLLGLDCEKVWVEADIENGLSAFSIVGLANQSIKESRDRIRSAIINCGFKFPDIRLTVNMTHAGRRKYGSHFDLPIALAVLWASGGFGAYDGELDDTAFLGELTLDGKLDPIEGALPMISGLSKAGIRRIVLPEANLAEASLIKDAKLFPVKHLKQLADCLSEGSFPEEKELYTADCGPSFAEYEDFSDIRGQESIKRAAQIAAAGFHGMLIVGPPGVGKSMVGKRIPGIMPPLRYEEQLELTQIYSIAGKLKPERPVISSRPFRSPHHSVSAAAMTGGGLRALPGEVSLAHNGVLFLDELPEFSAAVLESLRQPLEDSEVSIVRVFGNCIYPAAFMLVAAMNPCRCGYYGDSAKPCSCTESDRKRYMSKISGPLLDRIDLHIRVGRPEYSELSGELPPQGLDSAALRAGVIRACGMQQRRYKNAAVSCNARLSPAMIERFCHLDRECESIMREAFEKLALSARSYHRVIKLARTIADIEESPDIKSSHLLEALSYRLGF